MFIKGINKNRMVNHDLLALLIEIRDSEIFVLTKKTIQKNPKQESFKIALAYNLIEEFGAQGRNYRLTKNGHSVINSKGDISVLNRPAFSIQSDKVHVGNNYGSYNQSSSTVKNASNKTIKEIGIGIFVTVLGGLLLWIIIQFMS
jgi:hypothetical protein